jgi:hypothetical protein
LLVDWVVIELVGEFWLVGEFELNWVVLGELVELNWWVNWVVGW